MFKLKYFSLIFLHSIFTIGWVTRIKQLLLNNVQFLPGFILPCDLSQFAGSVFEILCWSYFHVGVYSFFLPSFVNYEYIEVIHWLCKKRLHAKNSNGSVSYSWDQAKTTLCALGIKPSLFCAAMSTEKLGMHVNLLYHVYCWERELLSFTVDNYWN